MCVFLGTPHEISSQPVHWPELVILDADSVSLCLLLQLPCGISAQVSVFVLGALGRQWVLRNNMDICLKL